MVAELHTLLVKSGVPQPYVLVGHSLAGLNIHLYASTYPKDVVGLVFVDALHPDLDARIEKLLSAQQGRVVVATHSHRIQEDEPEVASSAIEQVVRAARR